MAPQQPQSDSGGLEKESNHPKGRKRKRDHDPVDELKRRVAELETSSGSVPALFSELPLSQSTQAGLSKSHFKTLTTIQARALPSALKSTDLLGAAKTGSGKTLAFVIPVLENLYRNRWTEFDGLGALILSPTRELAIQIFEVLRKVGRYHSFSAGLIIGGKPLQEERERMGRMNILVATPGRMLQHMDQTAEFEVSNLQVLVLDEADRIMDMGFQATVDAIVEHLPKSRQTLLFSATQTKKVSDLARLSVREAEFTSVHEGSNSATPSSLRQNYVVTPLYQKIDTLWSFVRANVKKKILVFFSAGKQVRYVYEAFRRLQPGIPLLQLHGRQKQTARLDITSRFSSSKHACLLATDVAARGLDFPAVDWVVQLDCPEDAQTYIHRVGRTARYEREGQAALFLDPSEEVGMLKALDTKNVKIEKINVRQKKMQNTIKNQLQSMCFKDPEMKYLGQKCFASYVRSVYVQKDKSIFKIKELDLEQYANSLGLPGTPNVKFIKGEDAKLRKNAPRQLLRLEASSSASDEEGRGKEGIGSTVRTKHDRIFERKNQDVLSAHYQKMIDDGEGRSEDERSAENRSSNHKNNHSHGKDDEEGIDDFLSIKRRFHAGDDALTQSKTNGTLDSHNKNPPEHPNPSFDHPDSLAPSTLPTPVSIPLTTSYNTVPTFLTIDSKRREKILKSRKKLLKYKPPGSHLHFDEETGQPMEAEYYEREEDFAKKGGATKELRRAFLMEQAEKAKQADARDKWIERDKRKEKKEKRKGRERMKTEENWDEQGEGEEKERRAMLDSEDARVDTPMDMEMMNMDEASDIDDESQSKHNRRDKLSRQTHRHPHAETNTFATAAAAAAANTGGSRDDPPTRKTGAQQEEEEDLEAMAQKLLHG